MSRHNLSFRLPLLALLAGLLCCETGTGAARAPSPLRGGRAVAATYFNDFEGDVGAEWSSRITDTTPAGGRRFLGRFGKQDVTLTLEGLPAHTRVHVRFDLYVIGSMDGSDYVAQHYGPDIWRLDVEGGPRLVYTTFSNGSPEVNKQAYPGTYPDSLVPARTGATENNTLGYRGNFSGVIQPLDSVYHFDITLAHGASALGLTFSGAELTTDGVEDESWGLDNVEIAVDSDEAEEPPSAPALLAPADGATVATVPVTLKMSATAPLSSGISYKVVLLQDGVEKHVFNQLEAFTDGFHPEKLIGWDEPSYPSGGTATLQVPVDLAPGPYQWKAQAHAWYGSRTVAGPWSEVRAFTFVPPPEPALFGITPNVVEARAGVELRARGARLPSNLLQLLPQVELWVEQGEQKRARGAGLAVEDGNVFRATFDLSGFGEGPCDIVLRIPGSTAVRVRNAVTVGPTPDLAVHSVTLEPAADLADGQTVRAVIAVRNVGRGDASVPAQLILQAWGATTRATPRQHLKAGDETTIAVHLVARSGPASQLQVSVAYQGPLGDPNPANDTLTVNLPEVVAPELSVTALTIEPTIPRSGDTVRATARVRNSGGRLEGTLWVGFYVDGQAIMSEPTMGTLEGGAERDVTIYFPIRAGWTALLARADPANLVGEADEGNNERSLTLPEVAPPNLVASALSLDRPAPAVGAQVEMVVTVRNTGPGAQGGPFDVDFRVDGASVGTRRVSQGLAAGEEITVRGVGWRVRNGPHEISALVDPGGEVVEASETDNAASMAVDPPPTDLVIEDPQLESQGLAAGGTAFVRATLRNQGTGGATGICVAAYVGADAVNATRVDYLAPGASEPVRISWSVRHVGQATLRLVADPADLLGESGEANNETSLVLPEVRAPDLAVSDLSIEAGAGIQGGSVLVRASVRNTGGPLARSVWVWFRLGSVGVRCIPAEVPQDGVPAQVETTFTIPLSSTPVVAETLEVQAGLPIGMTDPTPNNNSATLATNIRAEPADLAVTAISLLPGQQAVTNGAIVPIQVTVANLGAPCKAGVTVRLAAATGRTASAAVEFTGQAEEQHVVSLDWQSIPGSSFEFTAWIAAGGDSAPGNNSLVQTLPLEVLTCDLRVARVEYSPQTGVSLGDRVTFSVTVANAGPGEVTPGTRCRIHLDVSGVGMAEGDPELGGLKAGEEKTFTFTWVAQEAVRPRAVAVVDAGSSVDERDEANNALAVDLPFDVARGTEFDVVLTPSEQACATGLPTTYTAQVRSSVTVPTVFDLAVEGLPDGWAALASSSVYLQAGEWKSVAVTVTPPADAAPGERVFRVRATRHGTPDNRAADAKATVGPPTAITGLLPDDGQTLASNAVVFTWRTRSASSSEVFLTREGEGGETRYEGPAGEFHRVVASGLVVGARYQFRVRSAADGTASESAPRTLTIAGAVAFSERSYTAQIKRDYLQVIRIPVRNLGDQPSGVLATVANPYDPEIVTGFAGAGSVDEALTLQPGASADLTLVVHAPNAARPVYNLTIRVQSGTQAEPKVDQASVRVEVPVKADLELQEVGTDPVTLVKTLRLINRSDVPVADVRLELDDTLKGRVTFRPDVQMLRVGAKDSVTVELVPVFELAAHRDPALAKKLSPGRAVRIDTPEAQRLRSRALEGAARVVSEAGEAATNVSYDFGDRSIWAVELRNRLIATPVNLDVCTNVRHTAVRVTTPPARTKDPYLLARLSPRNPYHWPVKPHSMFFSINGYPVGSINNEVPQGSYSFKVPASVLNLSDVHSTQQVIEVKTSLYNEAHYWRTGTLELGIFADEMVVYVAARSEDEALRIAQNQPYFQAHNDPEFDTFHRYLLDVIKDKAEAQEKEWYSKGKFLRAYSWWSGIVAPDAGGWTGAFRGWQNNCAAQYAPELNEYKCTSWAGDILDAAAAYKRQNPDTKMKFALASSQNGGHWFAVCWEEGQNPLAEGYILDPWTTQGDGYKPVKILDALYVNSSVSWDPRFPQLYRNFAPDNPGKVGTAPGLTDDARTKHSWPEFTKDQQEIFDFWRIAKGEQPLRAPDQPQEVPTGGISSLSVTVVGAAFPLVTDGAGRRQGILPDGTFAYELPQARLFPGNPPSAPRPVTAIEIGGAPPQPYTLTLASGGDQTCSVATLWRDEAGAFHEAVYHDVPLPVGRQTGTVTLTLDPNRPAQPIRLADGSSLPPETADEPVQDGLPADAEPVRQVFPPGLHMVAVPADLGHLDAAAVMGVPFSELKLARWNPEAGGGGAYSIYPDAYGSALVTGAGYWTRLARSTPVELSASPPPQNRPYSVPLRPGWNMVGSPFTEPLAWDLQVVKVRRQGQEVSLAEAQALGWVEDFAWTWEEDATDPFRGQYKLVQDARVIPGVESTLRPWKGYWVRAYASCELLLGPPTTVRGRGTARRTQDGGWCLRLAARGRSAASEVLVGTTGGSRQVSIALPPDPPSAGSGLRLVSLRGASRLAADLREGAGPRQEWELVVEPSSPSGQADEVRLSWPDLRGVPGNVRLTLVDTATGARRHLRTTAGYSFRAQGEARRFKLIAEPRTGPAVAITSLELVAGRAGARSVRFTLSSAAAVDVEVVAPGGQVVATLARGRASSAGMNQLAWTGAAAPGVYLLRATAITEEGASVQVVRPVVLVR